MTRRKLNNSRRLAFQQLEDRSLMTGNVTVTVQNHSLIITGDSNDNDVQIVQKVAGEFTVRSLYTTINGKSTEQKFTGITKDLKIDLKGGNDQFNMKSMSMNPFQVNGNFSLKTGDGNDSILFSAKIKGSMDIDVGAGDDTVELYSLSVGENGKKDATIQMGSGADSLHLTDFNMYHDLNIKTATSSNGLSLNIDSQVNNYNAVFGDFNLTTGNGADNLAIYNTKFVNDVNVKTNGGDDSLAISNIGADKLFADMGSGKDYLAVTDAYADSVNFNGGSGSDTLKVDEHNAPNHFKSSKFDSFETEFGFIHPVVVGLPGQLPTAGNKAI